jgi:hypothetical protein
MTEFAIACEERAAPDTVAGAEDLPGDLHAGEILSRFAG